MAKITITIEDFGEITAWHADFSNGIPTTEDLTPAEVLAGVILDYLERCKPDPTPEAERS